jgi:ElaB/YqjD/DUF883 family membrane-anchored ribosome-binding protein
MSHDNLTQRAEEIGETFTNILEPIEHSAEAACHSLRKDAKQAISRVNDTICGNPLPSIAGAFAFGIAIGCLIMSGRQSASHHSLSLREPLADAGDALSASLRTVYKNAKFW